MGPQGLLWLNAALSVIPASLFAGAAIEGRVELPKSRSAPVQAKRYEIVTRAGVLSTQPPLAVIYLDGNFQRPASLPTKEVGQKYFSKKTILSKGLTLGLRHLRESNLPILMANGQKKASIIQKALTLPPTLEIPASVIQTIPEAMVLLDDEAGELLSK